MHVYTEVERSNVEGRSFGTWKLRRGSIAGVSNTSCGFHKKYFGSCCFFQWCLAELEVALGREQQTIEDLTDIARAAVFLGGLVFLQHRKD